MASGRKLILSSSPLQILLFVNSWYSYFYFLSEGLMFIYKGVILPYPSDNLVLDVVLLVLYAALEAFRLFYASKGNLCERSLASTVSVLVLLPSAALAGYYMLLQTFVLRLEVILCALMLCLYSLELLLGLVCIITFTRSKVY